MNKMRKQASRMRSEEMAARSKIQGGMEGVNGVITQFVETEAAEHEPDLESTEMNVRKNSRQAKNRTLEKVKIDLINK